MRMRHLVLAVALLAAILPVFSYTFYNSYRWDINNYYGYIGDGSRDAYDGMFRLRIRVGSSSWVFYTSQREINTQQRYERLWASRNIGGANLYIERKIYVPPSPEKWARFLEIIENRGTSPVTVTIEVFGNLGSDGATRVWGTSDGDTVLEKTDLWIGTDDWDGSGDPSLAFVLQGTGHDLSSVTRSWDNLYFKWTYTISPGERIAILHFGIQAPNRATARSIAEDIIQSIRAERQNSKYLAGLSEDELQIIKNWGTLLGSAIVAEKSTSLPNNTAKVGTVFRVILNITNLCLDPQYCTNFTNIVITDTFPKVFRPIPSCYPSCPDLATQVVISKGNETATFDLPVEEEDDYYRIEIRYDDLRTLHLLDKLTPNESVLVWYYIKATKVGEYTLPAAEISYEEE